MPDLRARPSLHRLPHSPSVRAALAVGVALVALAGCGGGGPPEAADPAPGGVVPEPTPTPNPEPGGNSGPVTQGPQLGGCPMFPASAVFNTRIDALPVHPDSRRWINADPQASWTRTFDTPSGVETRQMYPIANRSVHADWGTTVDPSRDTYWGIPYNVVDGTTVRTDWPVVSFAASDSPDGDYRGADDESDCAVAQGSGWAIHRNCQTLPASQRRFPFPQDATIQVEGGIASRSGDHHVLVVEQGACRLWESWYSYKTQGGGWYSGGTAAWDLNSLTMRPDGWTSADAAGLPILPLLARAQEASTGEIRHALRVTLPSNRIRGLWRQPYDGAYVWPARHGVSATGDVPFGAVMRLKADVAIPDGWTTQARAVATAMKRYGLYVADIGSTLFVQGDPSALWQEATIQQLTQLKTLDFEFVDLTPITSHPGFSRDSYRAAW